MELDEVQMWGWRMAAANPPPQPRVGMWHRSKIPSIMRAMRFPRSTLARLSTVPAEIEMVTQLAIGYRGVFAESHGRSVEIKDVVAMLKDFKSLKELIFVSYEIDIVKEWWKDKGTATKTRVEFVDRETVRLNKKQAQNFEVRARNLEGLEQELKKEEKSLNDWKAPKVQLLFARRVSAN